MRRYIEFIAYTNLKEIFEKLTEAAAEVIGKAEIRLAILAIDLVKYALKRDGKGWLCCGRGISGNRVG